MTLVSTIVTAANARPEKGESDERANHCDQRAWGRRPAKDDKSRSISARAGAIRAAADGPKRMMHQATERGVVATNLHRILTRLERDPRPIPRVEVLRAVLRSPNPDSTKRLYEYALPENLGEESRKQRERKLARKAKGYMRFVEAAAALA